MSATTCAEPGCAGTVAGDGYCDTCGTRATPAASAPPTRGTDPTRCAEPGCDGTVGPDDWCDTCGVRAVRVPAAPGSAQPAGAAATASTSVASSTSATLTARTGSVAFAGGSTLAKGSRRVRPDSQRTSATRRSGIGAGVLRVPPAPVVDPSTVVLAKAEVEERKRFCGSCGEPVGRERAGRPGRLQGFCPTCRTRFDFVPKLAAGDLVGGQYEVVGALAHGGLGWIFLARDRAVSGRWVVLKGLLNAGDEAAMAAAVAERRFLAEVQHPGIVEIYNFVAHEGAGYTVMEYVGGQSLKQVLKQRRRDNGGRPDPLPVAEAIAFVLAVMPAFTYLHERGLVYCDFKPDNLLQVGDGVKLIDLGGVRRVDDTQGDIYGTVGFQAPEVPTQGVSVASDLYTIGRTLAVLTMDFRGYTSTYVDRLPPPGDHPALRDHDPFLRLVSKACAPHPDDRFQTAAALADQMLGVLRILVAAETGTPQPGPSNLFAGAPGVGDLLPWLAVDPDDPAAAFLARLPDDPTQAREEIDEAIEVGQLTETVEVRLRSASDLVEAGRPDHALPLVRELLADDPWEWRATWVEGYAALAAGDLAAATAAFERCRSEAPGELAPLFAAARTAEEAGERTAAAELYQLVATVDPAWVEASFGLARMRAASGDVAGAITALGGVPDSHRAHARAERQKVDLLLTDGRVDEALARSAGLDLAPSERAQLHVDLLDRTLRALEAGEQPEAPDARILDAPRTTRGVRAALEASLRDLARVVATPELRVALVDRANTVRPRTWL